MHLQDESAHKEGKVWFLEWFLDVYDLNGLRVTVFCN